MYRSPNPKPAEREWKNGNSPLHRCRHRGRHIHWSYCYYLLISTTVHGGGGGDGTDDDDPWQCRRGKETFEIVLLLFLLLVHFKYLPHLILCSTFKYRINVFFISRSSLSHHRSHFSHLRVGSMFTCYALACPKFIRFRYFGFHTHKCGLDKSRLHLMPFVAAAAVIRLLFPALPFNSFRCEVDLLNLILSTCICDMRHAPAHSIEFGNKRQRKRKKYIYIEIDWILCCRRCAVVVLMILWLDAVVCGIRHLKD